MQDYSVLIGGQAGDGIRQAGSLVARLLSSLGYRIYFWDDYPSLIRGGHNFSLIRACENSIQAYKESVDIVVALNEETAKKHQWRLGQGGVLIYDEDVFKADVIEAEACGLKLTSMVKEAGGKPVMRNVAALGAIARSLGIEWDALEAVIKTAVRREPELNLKIARASYDAACMPEFKVERLDSEPLPLIQGNEAIALGAARAGLKLYVSYPMTPSSSILHFLAANEEELGLVTFHPENEIAAVIAAVGGAYAGARTMAGSAGGGFALMVEGVSLVGQSEAPVVFAVSQRPGPSTGVPTYTTQGDLAFVLSAGHGEFVRLVVGPGDPDEAFLLTGLAMNMAWKYQIPTFVLTDKNLSESTYSFASKGDEVTREEGSTWDGKGEYKRYLKTPNGVSPLAFPGTKGIVVKGTSYEHDEAGITVEDPEGISSMQDKRMAKRKALLADLEAMDTVKIYGDKKAKTALLTWGSTKGACIEVAESLGLKVIQPTVLEPFPAASMEKALLGVEKLIGVENNVTAQLAGLLRCHGVKVDQTILQYDGRPFSVGGLEKRVKEVTA
ncbi:2-oxoacid:acceptor oxidoreductase subunit alpha [Candidatus Eisenbacteria bacterium]|uniref:2-oxoacid:acceptor oxidoreductase subunit alpha n=1 Tax=Eiseniibacteriota bacterium TaxID=2212470 RepID=A0ABV6YP88_UNCEI